MTRRSIFAVAALVLSALATACGDGICDPTGALHRYNCTPLDKSIPYHPDIVCKEDVPGYVPPPAPALESGYTAGAGSVPGSTPGPIVAQPPVVTP
jgi:hypothetical protein